VRSAGPARAPARPRWTVLLAVAPISRPARCSFVLPFRTMQGGLPDLSVYADDLFYYLSSPRACSRARGSPSTASRRPTASIRCGWPCLLALGAIVPPRSVAFFVALQMVLALATLAAAIGCHRRLRRTFGFAAPPALRRRCWRRSTCCGLPRPHGVRTGAAAGLRPRSRRFQVERSARSAARGSRRRCSHRRPSSPGSTRPSVLRSSRSLDRDGGARRQARGAAAPRVLAALVVRRAAARGLCRRNLAAFGAVMPVSGQAKQLAPGFSSTRSPPSISSAAGAHWLTELGPFNTDVMMGTLPALLIVEMAVLALCARASSRRAPRSVGADRVPLALFRAARGAERLDGLALVPVRPRARDGACRGRGRRGRCPRSGARRRWRLPVAVVLIGAGLVVHIALRAQEPHDFDRANGAGTPPASRPGIPGATRWATGPGVFGFLTDQRVVQTEGLVGDAHLLTAIRARRPLLEELAARGRRLLCRLRHGARR